MQLTISKMALSSTSPDGSKLGIDPGKTFYLLLGLIVISTTSCARISPTPEPVPTTDPHAIETQVAATVFAQLTIAAPTQPIAKPTPRTSTASPFLTVTSTPLRAATNTRLPSVTSTRTRTTTPTIAPAAPQKRFDSSKDGLSIVDIASGAQTKISSINGIASSAAWSPSGTMAMVAWMEQGVVKQGNGQYVCGYSYHYDPNTGTSSYGPDYCNNAPDYYSSVFGGGLRLVSRSGDTIADLASGSPEPHFVGDPQESYSDALWSVDAKRIAVLYKQADGNRCPFVGNADATGLTKLSNCEADDHPRFWSIDGKWMVAWSERGLTLYAYEVDGTRRVPLETLGSIRLYDERYFPWRIIDQPVCKGADFWSCE